MKQFQNLADFAKNNDITLSDRQMEQFALLCSALISANQSVNLTAISEASEIEIKHFIDSVAAAPIISELAEGKTDFSIIDVGTGGGFPGLPLKIVFPDADFTLLDSTEKKIAFVSQAADELKLEKISAVAGRAEELAKPGSVSRETFDFCVSRAVANTATLSEYCLPFVKVGGHCIFYKSGNISEELDEAGTAIAVLGGEICEIRKLVLPQDNAERSLVIIKKTGPTPDKYPRRTGKPSKDPIR